MRSSHKHAFGRSLDGAYGFSLMPRAKRDALCAGTTAGFFWKHENTPIAARRGSVCKYSCRKYSGGGKVRGGGGRLSRPCYAGGCQAAGANVSTKTPAPVAAGHSGGPHASRFAPRGALRCALPGFWDRMGAYVRSMRAQVGLRRMDVRPWAPEWPKPARPVPEGVVFLGAVHGRAVLGPAVLGRAVLGRAELGRGVLG